MHEKADPTNPVLKQTVQKLEEAEAPVWQKVAEGLGRVNRDRPEVNISDLERSCEEGDTAVVPGKLLGSGVLTKEIEVAAFQASRSARQKVSEKGDFMTIEELMEEKPEGSGVRVVE